MQHYTKKNLNIQQKSYIFTKDCSINHRCNNYKICLACFNIWKKKQFKKLTENLTEKRIKDFKYKYFLTVVSLDNKISAYEKNSNIDLFLNELTKNKRAKNNLFNASEYLSIKQISYNEQFEVNPHLHIIFLSNKIFKRDKKLKDLLSRFNLRIHKKDITKSTDNSYKTSILKLINYSLKYNPKTIEIEKNYKLTHNKSYIKKSSLFCKRKSIKKHKNLYIYIHQQTALINAFYNSKLKEAKSKFKHYNRTNPRGYIIAIKSFKKKAHKIAKARAYYKNLLKTLNIYNFHERTQAPHLRAYTTT